MSNSLGGPNLFANCYPPINLHYILRFLSRQGNENIMTVSNHILSIEVPNYTQGYYYVAQFQPYFEYTN